MLPRAVDATHNLMASSLKNCYLTVGSGTFNGFDHQHLHVLLLMLTRAIGHSDPALPMMTTADLHGQSTWS